MAILKKTIHLNVKKNVKGLSQNWLSALYTQLSPENARSLPHLFALGLFGGVCLLFFFL